MLFTTLKPPPLRRLVIACVWLGVCAAACAGLIAAEKPDQLKYQGYVSDFAGVLNEHAKAQLTELCTEVDQRAHAQIAIVTIKSLEGVPVEDFTVNLAQRWGVGPKQSSRGIMILLVPAEHKYRIEVGYGLEPILPDGRVGGFGREAVPLLRASNYGGALLLITQRIAAVIAQDAGVTLSHVPSEPEYLPRGRVRITPQRHVGSILEALFLLVFLIGFPILRLIFWAVTGGGARRRRWYGGGPWFMGGGSWGGGGFGGGGGGGGFGGFGGGSFGGGGASGSW